METMMKARYILAALALGSALAPAYADGTSDRTMALAGAWAQVKYSTPAAAQTDAMAKLKGQADALVAASPNRAEPLIWDGIITSTLAGMKGGMGGLSLAKEAKSLLEKAEKIDGSALGGSAHTSLGALYYQVPSWPIGFGSSDKARAELLAGLKANPQGIDSNYFWGDFLFHQGQYADAAKALKTALAAPARPGREVADSGRRGEIQKLLGQVNAKLKG
jgi:tetratricopeptide (TPR) repeat protein